MSSLTVQMWKYRLNQVNWREVITRIIILAACYGAFAYWGVN